jgi:hypothetical protein
MHLRQARRIDSGVASMVAPADAGMQHKRVSLMHRHVFWMFEFGS